MVSGMRINAVIMLILIAAFQQFVDKFLSLAVIGATARTPAPCATRRARRCDGRNNGGGRPAGRHRGGREFSFRLAASAPPIGYPYAGLVGEDTLPPALN